MTDYEEMWNRVFDRANRAASAEAVLPDSGAVKPAKKPTHEPHAADRATADRVNGIKAACGLAGLDCMASHYISRGFSVGQAVRDLEKMRQRMAAH